MARRKKQPQSVHRKNISEIAEKLFIEKGLENTSMNDIAKESGYSKASLYVYFKDKEELIAVLVLESMEKLYEYLSKAVNEQGDFQQRYLGICRALLQYHSEYPLYSQMALMNINIDFEGTEFLPEERETFQVGEKINELLWAFFREGIELGIIKQDINITQTTFAMWGMLTGVIQLSFNKKEYITQMIHMQQKEFLDRSFMLLYKAISVEE